MKNFVILFFILTLSLYAKTDTKIEFFGNKYFSNQILIEQLGLPDGFWDLDAKRQVVLLRLAAYNLEVLYENDGFFTNKVQLEVKGTGQETRYIYEIYEGTKFRYARIDIIDIKTNENLMEEVEIESKVSNYYNGELLTKDLDDIIYQFKERGYLHVRSYQSIELDTNSGLVYVQFEVDRGPVIKMGRLLLNTKRKPIEGKKILRGQTRQTYIRQLWDPQSGDIITGQEWDDFRAKLLATGLYSSVQLKDSNSRLSPGKHDIYVNLVERVPGQYSGRLFYEALFGFGVTSGVKHKNIQGKMHELSINATLAQHREQLTLGYGHPLFLGTGVRFDNRVTVRQDSLKDPTEIDGIDERFEAINKGTFSKRFNRNLRTVGLIDLRYVDKYNEQTELVKLKFEPSVQLDFTNKLTDPTKGARFRLAAGNGGTFKTSERYNYLKFESGYYYPLGSQLFWAGAIDWGKFLSTGDRDDAKLFYQGGFRSVRGYVARSIAPSKDSSYVYRGDTLTTVYGPSPQFLRLSNELRYNTKIIPNLQLVQFTDWAAINDLSPDYTEEKSMAMGLGIRYQVSLLTFRLDYTFKKDFFSPFKMEQFETGRISFDLAQAI